MTGPDFWNRFMLGCITSGIGFALGLSMAWGMCP